jgi:hypothetical protein
MITSDTITTQYPDGVEYRNHTASGTQVVMVHWQLFTPRISCYVEFIRDGEKIRLPLPLPLDELVHFCLSAAQRLGRNTRDLERAYQILLFSN